MAILGPLAQGTRIQFNINFTIPADYDAAKGDAVITDTLPAGLSLYANEGTTITDSKNAVTVTGAAVTAATFAVDGTDPQKIIITVPAANLAAGQPLVATVDTAVNASMPLTGDQNLSNTAALKIGSAYESAAPAQALLTLTALGNTPTIPAQAPIPRANTEQVTLPLSFKAPASAPAEPFTYYVDIKNPEQLLQSTITAFYGTTAGGETTPITPLTVTPTGISFSSDNVPADSFVKINIPLTTQNVGTTTPETLPSLDGTYAVSIGGIEGLVQDYSIPFNDVPQKVTVTKTVLTR